MSKTLLHNRLVYFIPADRWIYREDSFSSKGRWNLTNLLTRESTKHFLLNEGLSQAEIKGYFDESGFRKIMGFKMAPERGGFFQYKGLDYVNLWRAPRLESKRGSYPSIERVLEFMTKGDLNGTKWITHWIANKVQHPATLPKVALVFTSQQAGGKGTLVHVIREMLGMDNTSIIGQNDLESNFNDNWVFKLFVLGDEVLSSDRRKDISNQLKMFIDSDELTLEGKYKNKITVKNQISWMFASNAKTTPLVLEQSDRRYTVFTNHQAHPPGYREMLESLWDMHEKGKPSPQFDEEISAFKYACENLEVDYAFIKRPYDNEDRRKLIKASLPSYEHFFDEIRQGKATRWLKQAEEELSYQDRHVPKSDDGVALDLLYRAYVCFCKHSQARHIKLTNFESALENEASPWPVSDLPEGKFVRLGGV